MDRCIDCPALTLRAYKFRDEMVSGFLCRTGVPVVCTARLSENNCNQFFNFCQLCPEDVSVSDGREFNGEDDFSASVYRGNAKASCAAEIDHFHIGDTALFSGDSGRSRIYSGRHVPAKYPGNGEAGSHGSSVDDFCQ